MKRRLLLFVCIIQTLYCTAQKCDCKKFTQLNPNFSTEKWLQDSLGLSYRQKIKVRYSGFSRKCIEHFLGKPQYTDGAYVKYISGGSMIGKETYMVREYYHLVYKKNVAHIPIAKALE